MRMGTQIISVELDNLVLKWNFNGKKWLLSFQQIIEGVENCEFISHCGQSMFIVNTRHTPFLYDAGSDKYIRKINSGTLDSRAINCSLSFDGKQLAVMSKRIANVADFTRNHQIKSLNYQVRRFNAPHVSSSFLGGSSTKLIVVYRSWRRNS